MTGETRCPICGSASISNFRPCSACEAEMIFGGVPESRCSLCGIDLAGSDDPCLECRGVETPLEGVTALGPWTGALREWLSLLKYGGDRRLSSWTSEILAKIVIAKWPGFTVVPVPPRRQRILSEGYDAVGTIARSMGKRGIPISEPLKRTGSATQKSLGREERLRAVALKFELKPRYRCDMEEAVLLDDVSTTGSTLRTCAELLKSCGVRKVHGLVLCKD